MSNASRILVAGIGNIFLGDDGFGVEVAWRLARRPLPPNVQVIDFGVRSVDLTYALLDGYSAVILVDATARGGAPGTLYAFEPYLEPNASPAASLEAHSLNPYRVLELAASMSAGKDLPRLRLVGCEPASVGTDDEMFMGLSEPVAAAVNPAMSLVESMFHSLQEAAHA